MTDLETREDDWARGVFDRVRTGQHEPHWAPDAAAAARLSGRRRTRYRATGALAAVAVVGLSATAFTTLGGNVFRSRDTISPEAAPTIWDGLDLTKYLAVGDTYHGTSGTRATTDHPPAVGLATISTVLQRLDPGLRHIRTTTGRHDLDISPNPAGISTMAIETQGFWSPNGDVSSFPKPGTRFRPTTPFGSLNINTTSPAAGPPTISGSPCGLSALSTSGQIPQPAAWSTCVRVPQSDGSTIVTSHATGLKVGAVTVAARIFPDNSEVQIVASSVIGYQDPASETGPTRPPSGFLAGPPLNPVPWTDQSLAQALAGPEIKGLP